MAVTEAELKGKICQCSSCKEHFGSISAFDKHRQGDHSKERFCVNPETLGMIIRETSKGTFWASPPPENATWRAEP